MKISPASGVSSPRMHRKSVVFPPPEGPKIAANSPSRSPKVTSFRTGWPSMDLLSPRTSRVGIPTGPKGVGVEIRAEFGAGMACVERLFPGDEETRQQVMVFEPASGCPHATHDVFSGQSHA